MRRAISAGPAGAALTHNATCRREALSRAVVRGLLPLRWQLRDVVGLRTAQATNHDLEA